MCNHEAGHDEIVASFVHAGGQHSEPVQHTPGPWRAYWFCDNERTGIGHWSFTGGAGDLGILPRCSEGNATQEANARLIASAPDLLAGLIKAVALLEIATLNDKSLYGATCTQVARAIIAKAEGRDQ